MKTIYNVNQLVQKNKIQYNLSPSIPKNVFTSVLSKIQTDFLPKLDTIRVDINNCTDRSEKLSKTLEEAGYKDTYSIIMMNYSGAIKQELSNGQSTWIHHVLACIEVDGLYIAIDQNLYYSYEYNKIVQIFISDSYANLETLLGVGYGCRELSHSKGMNEKAWYEVHYHPERKKDINPDYTINVEVFETTDNLLDKLENKEKPTTIPINNKKIVPQLEPQHPEFSEVTVTTPNPKKENSADSISQDTQMEEATTETKQPSTTLSEPKSTFWRDVVLGVLTVGAAALAYSWATMVQQSREEGPAIGF